VIRLGLRLALAGGRGATAMAALTTGAIAAGTALLLLALTVSPALHARADRTAWTNQGSGAAQSVLVMLDSPITHTIISTSTDHYRDSRIDVVVLAGSGRGAPVPPGMKSLPAPGEVLVSPALAALLRTAPELNGRYGRVVGPIDDGLLPGPDALVAVRGVRAADAGVDGIAVTGFPLHGDVLKLTGVVRLLLLLGAAAMLAPIMLLVALATRLSAATRDRRLATLRLVGATTGQIARLAAAESLLGGVGGVLTGILLFFAIRPLATHVTYDGGRWFTSDLNPGLPGFAAVLVAVPLVTAATTQFTLARVIHSPLGVSRRTTPKPVRVWRLVPLIVAVPALGVVLSADAGGGHGRLVLAAFLILLATLLYAGPWLTRAVGLALARSGGVARLLAGRHLADDPRSGFRAIAGVLLAILIVTMFAAARPAAAESLRDTKVTGVQDGTAQAKIFAATPAASARLLQDVRAIDGVANATLVYEGRIQDGSDPANVWIGNCTEIVAATRLASVPCGKAPVLVATDRAHLLRTHGTALEIGDVWGAQVVPLGRPPPPPGTSIDRLRLRPIATALMPTRSGIDVPGLIVSPDVFGQQINKLRPTLLVLRYDTQSALERVRTLVVQQVPGGSVSTRASNFEGYSSDVRKLYGVLIIATLGAFAVAALGLVVAVATGLLQRRRPFALLRAAGTPLRTLQRTALLTAGAPLAAQALLAATLGALVGRWTVTSAGQSDQPSWTALLLPTAAGLAIAAVILYSAMPMVRRATDTEETRFE